MVFFGAIGVVFYVALLMHLPGWIALPVAIGVGCYVAIRVRKAAQNRTALQAIEPPD
jgi:EamA domain-containing membrane protein RarD